MTISLKETVEIRDRTHNLDLTNPEHYRIYEDSGSRFIKLNETTDGKADLEAYDDGKGFATIGFGFNMDAQGARGIWNQVIGSKASFDEVIRRKAKITEAQADKLFKYFKDRNLLKLQKIYGPAWDKLKPNEKIMIEDLYYNGGNKLAGKGTRFCEHIIAYTKTSDKKHLENALTEVRERSNHERISEPSIALGIQNRRDVRAKIGASHKCPLYSKPNDDPLPKDPAVIQAKLNLTIIPRRQEGDNDNYIVSDRFYIWRANIDSKVRPAHAANDGKIFDINSPPSTGNPGEDYNCRCTADFYIPDWVKVDPSNNKDIIRKHITDFSGFPDFVVKAAN